jgi:plasmid stability protein
MRSNSVTVDIPDNLLKRIRARARKAKRTVEAEVVSLLSDAVAPAPAKSKKPPRTSLADWADENSESWGDEIRSEDAASFTGRRY